ncbi:Pol I core factor CF [Mortierella sp. AM989]|nr:Pol I core factor CF [Mortierella sp. AM989]
MATRPKAKKPPCRICRSRKWRKNSLGFYVCEFGHQLEGHQEEEGEFDATIGSTFIRKKKAPKRKRRVKQRTVLTGANVDYLLLQSMQLILRRQIHALIHDLGFPPEIEQVAQEYWALYMSSLQKYQDNSHYDSLFTTPAENSDADGAESEGGRFDDFESDEMREATRKQPDQNRFRDKVKIEKQDSDALDILNEYQGDGNDSSSEESDGNIEGNIEDWSEESLLEEEELESEHDSNPKERSRSVFHYETAKDLSITFTIAICYLSAQHLKLPVVYGDFYRWVMHRKVPYYNALDILPPEMKCRLGYGRQMHKGTAVFQTAVEKLQTFFRITFGLVTDMPNAPPLIFRFTQELMLPVEVYPCAQRLSHLLFDILGSRLYRSKKSVDITKQSEIPTFYMAVVIFVAKLLFGLDGKKREFEELIQVNPDLYSEHCKKEIRPRSEPVFDQVLGVFQTTEYAQMVNSSSTLDRVSPSIEAFIKRLYSDIPSPDEPIDEGDLKPPPLKPGEGFVHYKPDNVNVYLGRYERLLAYASNLLCVNPGSLQNVVTHVEDVLVLEPNSDIEKVKTTDG